MDPIEAASESDPLENFNNDLAQSIDEPNGGTAKSKRFDGAEVDFWPEKSIGNLVNKRLVRQVCGMARPKYGEDLVDFIVHKAKKLFALTSSIDGNHDKVLARMRLFMLNGITDESLAAEIQTTNSSPSFLERLPSPERNRLWRPAAKRHFNNNLWTAVAPVFSTASLIYSFKTSVILPFSELRLNVKKGGFSTVHKAAIFEGYYKDDATPKKDWPKYFAVKEIQPHDRIEKKMIAQRWDEEAKMLERMNSRDKEHIVRFIAAFTRGDAVMGRSYYLMFEWADGGSLGDVYSIYPHYEVTPLLMHQAVQQLLGLAHAIAATHRDLEDKGGIRHGDLKPENILRFRPTDENVLGTLKIGDWGLAKYHNEATIARKDRTTTRFFTVLYEAPEWGLDEPLGRQYDIWSMGVIVLELIIWLLHGEVGIQRFKKDVMGSVKDPNPCYTISFDVKGQKQAKRRKVVGRWMEHLARDPSCSEGTAMGELLSLVDKELLVVALPVLKAQTRVGNEHVPAIVEPSTRDWESDGRRGRSLQKTTRATSENLVLALERISTEDDVEDYWCKTPPPDYDRKLPPTTDTRAPQDEDGRLTSGWESASRSRQTSQDRSLATEMSLLKVQDPNFDYKHPKLDDEWEFHVDNRFASVVVSCIAESSPSGLPVPRESANLCSSCQGLDFFNLVGFSIEYDSNDLRERAGSCDLCRLFWRTHQRSGSDTPRTVRFERFQSSLRMNGRSFPALSICSSIESITPPSIQIGLPKLPRAGSTAHFEIIRQWLLQCDDKNQHPICSASSRQPKCLPTRLIDVGQSGEDEVRLWEPGPEDCAEYIALSHPWGHAPHFITSVTNLAQHKRGIMVADLPPTFRDAIFTTRALGKRYLWVDSICIIQGRGGDFELEAKKMETVFSSAYCVIAASRARSQGDGFLKDREERDYVTIRKGTDAPLYICENIDNFDLHVLNGHLSKRGWVLQEHALARRTIFFTKHQTYWECGDGVRCETLTKMSNNLAAFLGDPDFPRIIMSASQGEKIIRFQNLYKTYSSLGFTNSYDRPIAVDGLENRLLKAFGARGGFGVFDETKTGQDGLLRRSLLWYRAGQALTRIDYPSSSTAVVPPSWSWMAYMGEIDYLRLEFGKVDWKEMGSPWSHDRRGGTDPACDGNGNTALIGEACNVTMETADDRDGQLYFDLPGDGERSVPQCVVLGVDRGKQPLRSKIHYFILVAPKAPREGDGAKVYERIGAGYLPGRCILARGERIRIH